MISNYDNWKTSDPRDSEPECPECGGEPGDYEDGYCCDDCLEEHRNEGGPDPDDDAHDSRRDNYDEGLDARGRAEGDSE